MNEYILLASKSAILSVSATIRKNNGDKGHSCLKPLPGLKNGEADLLMRTEKVIEVIQLITQFTKRIWKPK